MAVEKIQVPDLGSDDAVEVIELLVKVGDRVAVMARISADKK